jgi:mono/diheme cytochrome c family protein
VSRRLVPFFLIAVALVAAAGAWLSSIDAFAILRSDHQLTPTRARDLENGRVLFAIGGCVSCHGSPQSEDRVSLGGGKPLFTPFGTFYPPNISPDMTDGIGGWSEADFIRALREGTAPDGRPYYPAFPYPSYRGMSADDAADIFAYLKTLPPISGRAPPHDLPFPVSIRQGIGLWKLAFLTSSQITRDPTHPDAWNRGRFLVESVGHCGECHTPRTVFGTLDRSRALAGAPMLEGKGSAPNLTPDATGLKEWSEDDIASFLKDGLTPDGDSVGGSMTDVVKNTSALSDSDRAAIAAYLASLKPIKSDLKKKS